MPLVKGQKAKTPAGISSNIKTELSHNKSQAQSVAIALSVANKQPKKRGARK